jgi:prepilin-type N-terminal cleavage/methylation domain-containing protein
VAVYLTTLPSLPWCNTARQRAPGAFTLIELLMVLALIGMIGVMAVPRFAGHIARARVNGAVARIEADLAATRRQAKHSGNTQTIVFDVGTSSYSVSGWTSMKRVGNAYVVTLSEEPYRANITGLDLGGDASVTFDGYGEPDSGGYVEVGVGKYARRINITTSDSGLIVAPAEMTVR